MDTEIKQTIAATDKAAQYDDKAKRLLGQKIILAHILVKTVDEFKEMSPEEVAKFIEGTPSIASVPVEPGLTNIAKEEAGKRIVGFNSENSEINEGLIRFDIVFYVRTVNGLKQIIINIEAQQKDTSKYSLLNRAIFYISRLISSQKERDFEKSNFDDIKQVYSIWICMNMKENTLNHIHLTDEKLLGSYEWKGNLGLLNIVLIGLGKELPEHDENYELHRLLGALLAKNLSIREKLNIIEHEYHISVDDEMREEVSMMCNLSQGILEEGIEQGIKQGIKQGIEQGIVQNERKIITTMYKKGISLNDIAKMLDKTIEEVNALIQQD